MKRYKSSSIEEARQLLFDCAKQQSPVDHLKLANLVDLLPSDQGKNSFKLIYMYTFIIYLIVAVS